MHKKWIFPSLDPGGLPIIDQGAGAPAGSCAASSATELPGWAPPCASGSAASARPGVPSRPRGRLPGRAPAKGWAPWGWAPWGAKKK